jgi:dTDP-4-dehydrorhamnose reductase
VFDGPKNEPYNESDSPSPIEWYGETKYMAEQEVSNMGGDYTILRLAYPFRASHPQRPDLVRTIISKLKDGTMYPPFTDHTITPTFIDDICTVFDLIIEKKPKNEIFHCVGSSWHTDYEIAKMIKEEFELGGELKKGSLEEYLRTSDRPYQKTVKMSNDKLVNALGFRPKTFVEALRILRDQINSLKV